MPIVAAFSRWLSAALGLNRISARRGATMLGAEQWRWLENELATSDASAHIIVSSVQIFTSNPLFEGWGHFHHERAKLVKLIRDHGIDNRGLLFLSGDVHTGEFLGATEDSIAEVTSSGLTHSCTDGGIPKLVCQTVWGWFSNHRASADDYYLDRNFGTLEISGNRLVAQVRDVNGTVRLETVRSLDAKVDLASLVENEQHFGAVLLVTAALALLLSLRILMVMKK